MSNPDPKKAWEAVKEKLLKDIALIDDITPWQEKEPDWWLEMVSIRRQLQKGNQS